MRINAPTHRRRVLATLSAVAVSGLLLSGCSAGGGDEGGDVTLSYGIWDQAQKATMEKVVADFEKDNPNIKVDVQVTPWDSYFTKLRTAVTSGTAPDVFWLGKTDFPGYANGGALLPVDEQVKKDGIDLGVYTPASVKGATWKGKLLGLPKDVDCYALWYNKKLFKEAGVAEPGPGWTQQDLIDAAKKLTNPAKGQYGMLASMPDAQIWFNTVIQEGGQIITDDGTKSGLDTPEAIAGIQFWPDLINKYKVSPSVQQMSDNDADALFQSGKIAMMYGGSWVVNNLKTDPYVKENASIVAMPKVKVPGGTAGGITNVISAKTKHADAAWKFLTYLGSEKAGQYQAEDGIIPAYASKQQLWVDSAPKSFNAGVFLDQLKVSSPLPSTVDVEEWSTVATEQLTKVWEGKLDTATAAAEIAKAMNSVLAKSN